MTLPEKRYLYIDIITAFFVAILLISNIASTKMVALWKFSFDGGTLLFPISYIFGDILTEVYGYERSRRVIWIGFATALLMSATLMIVAALPPADGWELNDAYRQIIGLTPRIVLASLVAYFAGAFSNSFIMAKMKIATQGKKLWTRTVGSTLIGEGIDTILFVTIAFYGTVPTKLLIAILVSNYVFKCGVEIFLTPVTYTAIAFLKKAENEDHYDTDTNFSPFNTKI